MKEKNLVVIVWFKEEGYAKYSSQELRNLSPRNYMCSWDFDRMMKYAKRELELYNIDESSVVSFTIKNKSAQWEMGIRRER